VLASGSSALLTLLFFLVLPLIQAITPEPEPSQPQAAFDVGALPPPEVELPDEPEPEPEEEEPEPPELAEEAPLLDLAQLEMALNPSLGEGWGGPDFDSDALAKLGRGSGGGVDSLFSAADLDERPRPIHQPSPNPTAEARRNAPGKVTVLFIVDEKGQVENPIAKNPDHPSFVKPALDAVRQWRFRPGKREGEPVKFRMKVDIQFPKP